jgi:hypothetical protein
MKKRIKYHEAGENKETDSNIPLFERKAVILFEKSNGNYENLNRQQNQNFPKEEILRKLVAKTTKLHRIIDDWQIEWDDPEITLTESNFNDDDTNASEEEEDMN